MDLLNTEGIVLHSLNFKDYDLILTVFSPDLGVEKFFVKGALRPSRKSSAPSILALCEFTYRRGKSDLYLCDEVVVLKQQVRLRESLEILNAACELLQLVNRSQMPGKPAPELYQLLLRYLDGLPRAHDPRVLAASFKLKLLRHEGYLDLDETDPLFPLAYCRTLSELQDVVITPELEHKIEHMDIPW